MKDLWRTIKYASRFKFYTFLNLVLVIASTLFDLVPPLIYKLFFDLIEKSLKDGANGATYAQFFEYTALYIVIAIVGIIVARSSNYAWIKWLNVTEKSITEETFQHVQGLSLEYFSSNSTGKIIEKISKGIGDVLNAMSNVVFNFLPQIVVFLVATIVLFRIDWQFGLIIGISVPLFLYVTLSFNRSIISIHDDIRNDYEKMGAVRAESIMNIRVIKSYAKEAYQFLKLSKIMDKKVSDNMSYARKQSIMLVLRNIIHYMSLILAMSLGVYSVLNGRITLGSFILIWSYINRVYSPMNMIMRIYDDTLRSLRSVKRLFETLDTVPTVIDRPQAISLKIHDAEININNISFRYPDNRKKIIIRNFCLNIPSGKTVAIVGKSGSGKTTLAKLLMRFYDIDSGNILIDGQDISSVTQKSLREKIGYVLQDSGLFNATVLENIRFGKPNTKKVDAMRAAKVAFADEFINRLPKKYSTIVGEKGVKLSGGEQQRINIARAILKNAPILILDEATSSLDSESEQFIQQALTNLIKDKTTIIIAHRLSTVMKADLIVVMDKGKIVETGTHDDLVGKRTGIYKRLYEIQSGGYLK